MQLEKDHAIRELARQKMTIRGDLVFTPHRSGGEAYYIVEDPVNSKFHRVGLAEYAFISLLDGKTAVGEALRAVAAAAPENALSEQEAAGICKWLVESELAHTPESSQASRLVDKARSASQAASWQRYNPIVFRLPLLRPNRLFESLAARFGWIHSRPALAAWLLLTAVGIYQVAFHWDRFLASSRGVLAPGNWLWLLLCWIVLKVVHEMSHGIACRRHGGTVREAGVLLILFAPIAYVDVTSSWRFRSKWQRIHTAAAGMYIEGFIASLAAMVWSATAPGSLNNICHNLVIMASFTTVVINANPLMRFDGYYIFSDLAEIPNLYGEGQQYLSYWARRYLLGVPVTRPSWSRDRGVIVPLYGVAALCWRAIVSACLVIAATALFRGAGIILAVLAAALWLGVPTARCVHYLFRGKAGETPNRMRLAATAGTAAVITAVWLVVLPWPGLRRAPAVVEYSPLTRVRAVSSGFVRQLPVQSGQQVEPGAVLAVLANDQLQLEAAQLRIEIEQSKLNCRMFKQAGKMASYQAEVKNLKSLETKSREKDSQVAQLVVRAPVRGKIVGRDLRSLPGTYLAEGDLLLSIGDERHKELQLSISQDDLDAFKAALGQAVTVRLPYRHGFADVLDRLNPQATLGVSHPALSAAQGGPLAVRPADADSQQPEERFQWLTPRFDGTVKVGPDRSRQLRAGQVGYVAVGTAAESFGGHLYNLVARWVRRQVRRQS